MTTICKLNEFERLDDLLAGGLKIIQNTQEFCFSLDAVLLAHFARIRKRSCGIDLGTGTGVIPLLLSSYVQKIDAIEINSTMAELAKRNVALNHLEDKITIKQGNFCHIENYYPERCMDFVISNPPYRQLNQGVINKLSGVARARHELTATLDDVVKAASYLLKGRGRFAMVHLPERLGEIMVAFHKYHIEAKRMQLVQPKRDKAPNILLIEGIKDAAPGGLKVAPSLIVHEDNGDYTPKLMELYYPDKLIKNEDKTQ